MAVEKIVANILFRTVLTEALKMETEDDRERTMILRFD